MEDDKIFVSWKENLPAQIQLLECHVIYKASRVFIIS